MGGVRGDPERGFRTGYPQSTRTSARQIRAPGRFHDGGGRGIEGGARSWGTMRNTCRIGMLLLHHRFCNDSMEKDQMLPSVSMPGYRSCGLISPANSEGLVQI